MYGEPFRRSLRANTVLLDGKVVGMIGVSRDYEWGTFFSDFKPELQPHLKSITVMRAVRDALEFVKSYRGPVLSMAEHGEGCRILHRLGFTHLHGWWYGWLR